MKIFIAIDFICLFLPWSYDIYNHIIDDIGKPAIISELSYLRTSYDDKYDMIAFIDLLISFCIFIINTIYFIKTRKKVNFIISLLLFFNIFMLFHFFVLNIGG